MTDDNNEPDMIIRSESIFGAHAQKALVKVTWGAEQTVISTEDARKVAYDLLDTAHASEIDACVYKWLIGSMGMDIGGAAMVLREFRQYREENASPADPREH